MALYSPACPNPCPPRLILQGFACRGAGQAEKNVKLRRERLLSPTSLMVNQPSTGPQNLNRKGLFEELPGSAGAGLRLKNRVSSFSG